ncbi:prephenate dehydratase [Gordonia rhizosphera]|uniref:Prephenate dehydratase n=1 Tax=Gordonia rhizosphera NBRC 16068 TaxID=1108045 RepID=K6VZ92_9ACTN|nr:prephenate dehydratase [Gordonia rhizosphera]GAB92235.1 prephenate dehydratase [Gordonia rhizosphera NBRC 16068]
MTVFAYFGPSGTFTEMALDKMLASWLGGDRLPVDGDVHKVAANSPAATIAMVRSGAADYGCVPVESSVEGSVPATADALAPPGDGTDGRVQVFGEVTLDIAFTIAARAPIPAGEVRTVAAYPVAAAQVRESVEKLYPGASFQTASSNAAAAQDVVAGRADVAVTTALAVQLAGLVVVADGVADVEEAATRFLLVGPPAPPLPRTGADRTSVILDLPNVPGSLMSAMNEFASRGIDLTRIESRPRRGMPGSYRFYLDAVGHLDDDAVGEALRALHRRCERVVFLGSWPAARSSGAVPPDTSASRSWFEALKRGEG